ncbi:MAG: ethanolamine utilization protein EutN [Planctomycetes bacterium]|nr:ethanolamine utilization protein EutN [Planctomycetota bacterium]MCB9908755.1 ethanolamine utilization protein EutN [Planctomycetota bacterium]MCB9912420.1 ethanolamine utilization protein EutN [Planctomycetota bacterium]HPF14456.1 EutN/CcmL family microcompartment protein [Planctomycetota bacterium]
MFLARVTGRVVVSTLYEGMQGVALQWIQPLDEAGAPQGAQMVACAAIESGPGDLVEVVDGREAALALPDETFVPVDAAIVGYVEQAYALGVDLAAGEGEVA